MCNEKRNDKQYKINNVLPVGNNLFCHHQRSVYPVEESDGKMRKIVVKVWRRSRKHKKERNSNNPEPNIKNSQNKFFGKNMIQEKQHQHNHHSERNHNSVELNSFNKSSQYINQGFIFFQKVLGRNEKDESENTKGKEEKSV